MVVSSPTSGSHTYYNIENPVASGFYPTIQAKCHFIDFRQSQFTTLRNVALDMPQFFTDFLVLPTDEIGNRANEPKTRKCESTYVDNSCKAVAFVDMTTTFFIFQGTKVIRIGYFGYGLRPYQLAPWCVAVPPWDDLSILQNNGKSNQIHICFDTGLNTIYCGGGT
jgi:hypothetical protein